MDEMEKILDSLYGSDNVDWAGYPDSFGSVRMVEYWKGDRKYKNLIGRSSRLVEETFFVTPNGTIFYEYIF